MKDSDAPGEVEESSQDNPLVVTRATRFSFWPQLRRLLVFQVKLYVDAFRDVFLSLLSLIAFVLDVVLRSDEKDSMFTRVLRLGRRSERAINLFEQHDPSRQGKHTVDGIIRDVEEKLSR